MKRKFLFVGAMLLASISYGQKVDIDKESFRFDYRALPYNPLNPEYKTYSVSPVSIFPTIRETYTNSMLEQGVNIQGLKRVSDVKGHVIVELTMDDLFINSSNVTERVEVIKDKDGKETGRRYFYKVDVSYTWGGVAQLKDYKGNDIFKYTSYYGSGPSAKSWSTSEFSSSREAADYYNNNRTAIRGNLVRKEVGEMLDAMSNYLSINYGTRSVADNEFLWILDSKKHPEFQAQQDVWTAFKAAMVAVNTNEIPAEAKAKLEETIKYFDGIPAKYATDEKGDKKLRYAAFFNKAKIYLVLDNPDAAIKEAEALIANGYDDGDGKRLIKDAEALKGTFKKNNTNTRHFVIDFTKIEPPPAN